MTDHHDHDQSICCFLDAVVKKTHSAGSQDPLQLRGLSQSQPNAQSLETIVQMKMIILGWVCMNILHFKTPFCYILHL